MGFLIEFLFTLIKYIFLLAVVAAGVITGKNYRQSKEGKKQKV